jgi:hypothetical protein
MLVQGRLDHAPSPVVRCLRCRKILSHPEAMRRRMGRTCHREASQAAQLERAMRDVPGAEAKATAMVAERWRQGRIKTKHERLKYRVARKDLPRVVRAVEDFTAGHGDLAPYRSVQPLGAGSVRAKRGVEA